MTRTKKPQKKSSIKKELGRSVLKCSSSFSNFETPRKQSEDLNALLSRNYESTEDFLKEFKLYYEKKLEAHRKKYESACEYARAIFKEMIDNLPEAYLSSKVNSNCDEDLYGAENKGLISAVPKAHASRARKPEIASCEFKRPKTPRVNRSSSRKRSMSAPTPMCPPPDSRFKTPSSSFRTLGPMSVITPKVTDTPMCVLRRPEHGEVVFSTSGSPLLVGRISLEDVPTVTVPLQDGRIFSILPDPEAGPPTLPEFDEETKRYLKTLRQHLTLLAPNTP